MLMMKRLSLFLLFAAILPLVAQAQVKEPAAFFYTANWDSAGNDIISSTLQRIQLTSTQYEEARNRFIESFVSQVSAAALVPGAVPTPAPVVAPGGEAAPAAKAEIRLSLDPKVSPDQAPLVYAFDVAPIQTAVAGGNDPRALAEWSFFYWQILLWENYISRGTLMLPGLLTVTDMDRFANIIDKPREPVWTWTEIDPQDEEPKEWVQSTREFPTLPPPSDAETPIIETLRTLAAAQGGQIVDPQIPAEADQNLAAIMRIYGEAAFALDAVKHDQYWGVINSIRQRQEDRDKYAEWLGDRQELVNEYAQEWARKYDGSEFDVDGVQFLVSERQPIKNVPPNARNIVIDKQVVPYDLLNEDGTLKKPIPTED